MSETLKEKTAKGLFWGGLSNGLQQLLGLLFGIVLARKLTQDDYGMVGMLTVFSSIASALQEGGFISALNKKKEIGQKDYNAVFWFSFLCGIILYAVLFFCAPLIAQFFKEPALVPLARYVFLGFVITSLGIVPRAVLFRNLKTREAAITSFSALTISGIVGVVMALNGMAYWGIATQTIVYVSLFTLFNYYFSGWRPSPKIDLKPIREMIGFSSRLVVTNVFNILNINLFSVIFGHFYTKTDVGNFSQARKWTDMGSILITNMLFGIAQPVFARVDEDRPRQLNIFRKLLRFTAFVSFPAMFGLCIISQEVVVIAITEKWLPSVPFMQLLCIGAAFTPVATLFFNLLISRGRSDIYMWGTIGLSITQLGAVFLVSSLGMMAMVRTFVAINILWIFVWWHFVRKEIGLHLKNMIGDQIPYLLLSVVLCVAAYYLCASIGNIYLRLGAKVIFVGALYSLALWGSGSVIFKESIHFLLRRKIE